MEVDAAPRLQHAAQFDDAGRHHREVGHHVVPPQEAAHRADEVHDVLRSAGDDLLVGEFGLEAPMPRVVERLNLRRREFAGRLAKEHVVGRVGVERRIEIDQIDALVRHMLAQDGEVVPEVEFVAPVGHNGMLAGAPPMA